MHAQTIAEGRVTCPECERFVRTFSDGKLKPHYSTKSGGLCPGTYTRA